MIPLPSLVSSFEIRALKRQSLPVKNHVLDTGPSMPMTRRHWRSMSRLLTGWYRHHGEDDVRCRSDRTTRSSLTQHHAPPHNGDRVDTRSEPEPRRDDGRGDRPVRGQRQSTVRWLNPSCVAFPLIPHRLKAAHVVILQLNLLDNHHVRSQHGISIQSVDGNPTQVIVYPLPCT